MLRMSPSEHVRSYIHYIGTCFGMHWGPWCCHRIPLSWQTWACDLHAMSCMYVCLFVHVYMSVCGHGACMLL